MKSLKQMLTLVNNKNIGYKALVYSQFTDTIKNVATSKRTQSKKFERGMGFIKQK